MDKDANIERRPKDTAQTAVEVMRVATGESDEKPHRSVRIKVTRSKSSELMDSQAPEPRPKPYGPRKKGTTWRSTPVILRPVEEVQKTRRSGSCGTMDAGTGMRVWYIGRTLQVADT